MTAATSTMAAPVAATNTAPILSLNNIEVVYDRVILVLKGVSLAVANGGNFIHAAELDKALVPFRQIRDAVGDRMEVMVELHSMWDLTSALAIARGLRQFNPFWAEDPIKMVNPQALAGAIR